MRLYVSGATRTLSGYWGVWSGLLAMAMASALGCRSSELLTVPTPPGLVSKESLADTIGSQALYVGAIGEFALALGGWPPGIVGPTGMLSDEIRFGNSTDRLNIAIDARSLANNANGQTAFDVTYTTVQTARVLALEAAAALEQHPPAQAAVEIGELFALAGYTEILLGEDVCSGDPLSELSASESLVYGDPLPTDSLFTRALANFDSAVVHAGSDATINSLAAVGRGRALLGLGRFAEARTAVTTVTPTFVYGTQVTTVGIAGFGFYRYWNINNDIYTVADRKGGNGLDFVSAHDPRMVIRPQQGFTHMGLPSYYPLKFPANATANDSVPLADGVEAQLIVAEAALAAGDVPTWLATLNGLRANFVALRGPYPADTSYHTLGPLGDPGSDSARVSLTFRERAFWLYGTAHRLADLRRLIRQYGRDQSVVFPTGPYDNGTANALFPTYGASVALPIGVGETSNPKFHGCSSTQA